MLHLENNETIIWEVRKHWFDFVWSTALVCIAITCPPILYFLAFVYIPPEAREVFRLFQLHTVFIYSLWLLCVWILFAIQWTNFYLDVWYVTQRRIIDVEQKGIFHREISNLRFDKIQDITIEVEGFIATMLNFGDIHVQTAAEDSSDFTMKNARDPEGVRKIIFSQHNFEGDRPREVKIQRNRKNNV